jgi:hypothetical protein
MPGPDIKLDRNVSRQVSGKELALSSFRHMVRRNKIVT